jgi:CMP-N,N'-diacetyllegionaminic acid synthase
MLKNKKVLGVIPARGGSKRLSKKNIFSIGGKPLIYWTIHAAKESRIIDHVVLTTDELEIAEIAKEFDIDEVIIRPPEIAQDSSTTTAAVHHVLRNLKPKTDDYEYVTVLQPTSPLRTERHIDEAFRLLEKKGAAGLVSVAPLDHPIEWAGYLSEDGFLDSFIRDTKLNLRSQECNQAYRVNGAIYIVHTERFLDEETLFLSNNMIAYIMKKEDSVDIDDRSDAEFAHWQIVNKEKTR